MSWMANILQNVVLTIFRSIVSNPNVLIIYADNKIYVFVAEKGFAKFSKFKFDFAGNFPIFYTVQWHFSSVLILKYSIPPIVTINEIAFKSRVVRFWIAKIILIENAHLFIILKIFVDGFLSLSTNIYEFNKIIYLYNLSHGRVQQLLTWRPLAKSLYIPRCYKLHFLARLSKLKVY